MPAPKFLAGMPKPVLFGLYGAIGGLLGALVFGELIMWALEPKKAEAKAPPPPEPRLAVTASNDLQIYQGSTSRLVIEILRDEFDGEVKVKVEGLPPGVTASEVSIPAGQTKTQIELRAAMSANPGAPGDLRVDATAKVGEKTVSANAGLKLTTLAAPMPQADIVFVLDVTQSMQGQIDGLKDGIGTFANDLYRAKVDARFACLAFRDLTLGEPSQLLKFKGEVFTSDAGAFRDEVARLRAAGGGDLPESSFEAISEAARLKDWRKSAVRTLILITDAPPKEVVGEGQSKKATIDSLRDNKIEFLHLVVNQSEVPVYREIQQGAIGSGDDKAVVDRGKIFNLSTVARDRDAMTSRLLPEMTKAIVAAAETKAPPTPKLEERPAAKPELPPVVKGVQSSESYDKSASAQLVLAVGVWTGAIAALVCLFLLGGQHHYLRGTLPAAGGILAGLGGGLLVGIVGGAAGQGLFLLATGVAPDSDTLTTILDALFRVMGWTILGALAGMGLAFFVPNLKLAYGLGGGAVGGAVGAIGFLAVSYVMRAVDMPPKVADVLGRLAGGLVLGLFIGLMVAVVEAAFRRAWLEVRFGPREVVTVNLGAEPVKIGGDSRACTVWARGAADVALRYFIREGKVICTDVPAREEFVVSDGDTREVGNVTVAVRTGSGGEQGAKPPRGPSRRPAPPPVPKPKKAENTKPPLLELGDDEPLPLPIESPLPAPLPPPAPPRSPTPAPARPPVPTAAARPPVPKAPPPRPVSPPPPPAPAAPAAKPAITPTTRDPDACPGCGRKNPGRPGTRYCMVCDQTY